MSNSEEPSPSLKNKDNVAPSDPNVPDEAEAKQTRVDALLRLLASIPPIVDILLSNLSYKDNLTCLYVCKLWSSMAQGYLWRHVRFHDVRAVPVPLTDANKAIIRSRARRIRSLATPVADTTMLDMQCTQLHSLELCISTTTTYPPNDFFNANFMENLATEPPFPPAQVGPSALWLIPMNRHLSTIDFKHIESLSRSFTPELFLSISQLPLQSLRLGLAQITSETLALAAFLTHCPSTLERLEIYYACLPFHIFRLVDTAFLTHAQAAQLQLPSLLALRTLKMSLSVQIRHPAMILFPLLHQCPNLEELWMPPLLSVESAAEFFNLILRNCRSIKILRLSLPRFNLQGYNNRGDDVYPSQDLLRVVNAYRSLREVELHVKLQDEYPVIPTLLLNSGWSLEIIELSCYNPEHGIIRNPYVSTILQSCNQLKKFGIHGLGNGQSPISLRELVETNWASNQLESLSVLVSEKEFHSDGWLVESIGDNEKLQEDIAMLLFQLSMKYRAQKKYKGPIPSWLENDAMLLPFEAAVKHTDGAMSLAAWKRIRPEKPLPLCSMPRPLGPPPHFHGTVDLPVTTTANTE